MEKQIEIFPPLPLTAWESTKDTLHLYLQIVGKIRLALAPRKNHWWFITLYVTKRGLATSAIHYKNYCFEIEFDFLDHELAVSTSRGDTRKFDLYDGLTVAQFYQQLFQILNELDIKVGIKEKPYDNKSKEPFAECVNYASYDTDYVHRFWVILVQVDMVFKEFSGRFYGKVSPTQLYWHHMDLTVTRFSGRRAPALQGGTLADRDAYSHEVISAGFWAGDDNVRDPAFYCYTYPAPAAIDQEPLAPASASWVDNNGSPMALLMYDDLRKEPDPKAALLAFLESSYQAGAKLAGWDIEELTVQPL